MAVWEPPDYRKLYDEECLRNKMLQCKNDQLRETLRDQFAMAALQGFLGSAVAEDTTYQTDAETAYKWADAMLEARQSNAT
jgi:hypothetical protein